MPPEACWAANASSASRSSTVTSPHTERLTPRCGWSASAITNFGPSPAVAPLYAHATEPRRREIGLGSFATGWKVSGTASVPSVPRRSAPPRGQRDEAFRPSGSASEPQPTGTCDAARIWQRSHADVIAVGSSIALRRAEVRGAPFSPQAHAQSQRAAVPDGWDAQLEMCSGREYAGPCRAAWLPRQGCER